MIANEKWVFFSNGTKMGKIDKSISIYICNLLIFMASRGGFEPPACPLGGGRSIQLSYRDKLFLQF